MNHLGPSWEEIPAHLREGAVAYHAAGPTTPQVVSARVYDLAKEYAAWLNKWYEEHKG